MPVRDPNDQALDGSVSNLPTGVCVYPTTLAVMAGFPWSEQDRVDELTDRVRRRCGLDEIVEGLFGGAVKPRRPHDGFEVARRAGDDADDEGIGPRLIRAATLSPATRFRAAICSPTVAESPGMVRLRRAPAAALSMVAAWIRNPTADAARHANAGRPPIPAALPPCPPAARAGCWKRFRTPPCWEARGECKWSAGEFRCRP